MNGPEITDNPKELDPRRHDTPKIRTKADYRRLRMKVRAIKTHSRNARLGLYPGDYVRDPNDFCACGSQKKYKQCCLGKGIMPIFMGRPE